MRQPGSPPSGPVPPAVPGPDGPLGLPVVPEKGQEWWECASCRGRPVAAFFPSTEGEVARAIALCRQCPVRDACLDYARAHRIDDGVWGGMSERDRRRLRR